jgi:hypothetical protein
VALGVAGAIALSAPSSAAPVVSSTTALKNAAPSDVVQTASRRFRRAAIGAGIGFAAGTLLGAAATSAYAYPYSYAYAYPHTYYDPYWHSDEVTWAPAAPVFASACPWWDPWCSSRFGATFAAPAPTYIEPAPVFAGPAPVVQRRSRVIVEPGPTVFAGPQPLIHNQLLLDANPALGTIHGASGTD